MKLVYTAQSKKFYFAKMLISQFTFEHDAVPLNPFNVFAYFLHDMVDRKKVMKGNARIIEASDEIWAFGPIADGVLAEIKMAMELGKPIKFFTAGSNYDAIKEIDDLDQLHFEDKALRNNSRDDIIFMIKEYVARRR